MAKLVDKKHSATHRVLLFGAPKTGKTQLAGELAQKFKVILFDLENGYATLVKMPEAWKENVEIVSLPDTRSYPIAIETMLKVIKGGECIICDKHGKVLCPKCKADNSAVTRVCLSELGNDTIVVVDSLTQLTNSAIANITKLKADDYKMEFDDWANLGKLLDTFLSHVQQATYNVICITHETESEMEDGKMRIVPTAGTRNFSRNTAKYFDEVVYCEVKNKKHSFGSSTGYANNILTGSRTDTMLEKQSVPSLLSIFERPVNTAVVQQDAAAGSKLTNALAALKNKSV